MASTRKDGQPRASTRGRKTTADQTNWKRKWLSSSIKFGDRERQEYLEYLAKLGRKMLAAEAVGVTSATVANHRANDPDFDKACDKALEAYTENVTAEVRRRAIEGVRRPQFFKGQQIMIPVVDPKTGEALYDDNGNIRLMPYYEDEFSDALLAMEAKRVDSGYKDRQQIELDTTGTGVLVAPAEITPDEWIARQQAANEGKEKPDSSKE